ncbi:hypothetical protein [Microbulbifer variabilis]|uniref:Uncharacterized protein n=1 Tax=Microbulbifer variabilis TaxID=266805 RepID=A0ABY4VGE6_9GAMM|nr:hypothetical protein [Microbulbifer variabilis]USD23362.1 hypothetical protein MJO52_09555 [Microbulbifer variabilis]
MKKASILLFLFILSAESLAVTNIGLVDRIYPSGESVKFRLKEDSCNGSLNEYYEFALDSEIKKAWFSILLSAAATGAEVAVRVEVCEGNRKSIDYLYQDF